GPNPYTTERIVRLLEHERVPATFFMVGVHVARFADAARQVAGAGCAIGNHTETHRRLWLAGPARTRWELATAHETIARATGVTPPRRSPGSSTTHGREATGSGPSTSWRGERPVVGTARGRRAGGAMADRGGPRDCRRLVRSPVSLARHLAHPAIVRLAPA